MQALLLIAGRSKRFWPLTEKSFVHVAGRSLLDVQVERLRAAGVTAITLVGGAHNLAAARERYPDLPVIEQRDLERGMQGALESALPSVKGEPVMIVSGNDIVESGAYVSVQNAMKDAACDGALLAKKVRAYFPGGYVVEKSGRLMSIMEKPGAGKEPGDLVTIVVHAHRDPAALLALLKKADPTRDDGYETALTSLFQEKTYKAVPYEGAWQAVKYPWHLLPLQDLLLQEVKVPSIAKSAFVHPSAVVEGPVILGEGARILAHAAVIGPCVIGARSIVGNGALVRGSSVGADCVIGFASEVARSVLGDHVWTHSTYLGDCVVGSNVSFGAGCIAANLRLDEGEISSAVGDDQVATGLTKFGAAIGSDSRIGVRVSFAPGIKVGEGTFVASNVHVEADVPAKSFLRMKNGVLERRENAQHAPEPEDRERFKKGLA